jgi:hypothetical protein
MEYDKRHLTKLLALVEEIYKDADNKEFAAGLNALTLPHTKGAVKLPVYPSEKLDDIYEYCLSKNLKQQARGFYSDFPLLGIKDALEDAFVLMEEHRRRDNFPYFCQLLFKQIELIVNSVCQDPLFDQMVKKMYPQVLYNSNTLYSYVYGTDKDGQSSKPLTEQFITYRFSFFVIFIMMNYKGLRFDTPFYTKYKSLYYELSQIRNDISHGGVIIRTDNQKLTIEKVTKDKHSYYFKFSTLLSDVVSCTKGNYPLINQ